MIFKFHTTVIGRFHSIVFFFLLRYPRTHSQIFPPSPRANRSWGPNEFHISPLPSCHWSTHSWGSPYKWDSAGCGISRWQLRLKQPARNEDSASQSVWSSLGPLPTVCKMWTGPPGGPRWCCGEPQPCGVQPGVEWQCWEDLPQFAADGAQGFIQ